MKSMKSSLLFIVAFVGSFSLIHLKQMASAETGKIVFTLLRDGNGGIYIIDDNGKNLRQLTDHLAHDSYPAWLPDGRHIVFRSNRNKDSSIYTMDLDGKNIKRIVGLDGRQAVSPAVSPNGQWIAQTPDEILLLVAIDGLQQREIHWEGPQGVTGMAAWSPDAKRLAFTIRILGMRNIPGVPNDIYVVDITGENLQQLTAHPAPDRHPAWSPDGQWIAFQSERDGDSAIYRLEVDGANPKWLANGRRPEWSPDGQQIAFVSRREGIGGIFIMDRDGENIRLLVEGGDHPAWFGSQLAVSDAGKWITLWGQMKREPIVASSD